jgi:hypothetical protein
MIGEACELAGWANIAAFCEALCSLQPWQTSPKNLRREILDVTLFPEW